MPKEYPQLRMRAISFYTVIRTEKANFRTVEFIRTTR